MYFASLGWGRLLLDPGLQCRWSPRSLEHMGDIAWDSLTGSWEWRIDYVRECRDDSCNSGCLALGGQ